MRHKVLLKNMMDEKWMDKSIDAYRVLCEKQGNDNYTAVLIAVG